MTRATATITRAFERYVDTFQSLDPKATLGHLHVPSLILDARGPHVLSSKAEAEAFLTTVMRDLDARGYARSEIAESHVHVLSETTALVSVSRVRRSVTDRELERLGETYTLPQDGRRLEDRRRGRARCGWCAYGQLPLTDCSDVRLIALSEFDLKIKPRASTFCPARLSA